MQFNRPIKRAAGCVVYHYADGTPLVLLIHDKYGCWTLPKGHLKPGEPEEQAAIREVWEETAVQGTLGPLISRIVYTVAKSGDPREKQVAFFLLCAAGDQATPQAEEGIGAAEWFAPDVALALIDYPQVRDVLARAIEMIVCDVKREM
ncbi:MAG TPA: NUDIX hydrolase [Roseiflexaceae bacterium]|jgi:8-oxo-dGTP diphosphatase